MLLRGSVILSIGLVVGELVSQEPKTTGHAELTYIHQGPLRKQTGLKAMIQQADLRIIRALAYCPDMLYSFQASDRRKPRRSGSRPRTCELEAH